jgi:CheY-like chemotaxis protein
MKALIVDDSRVLRLHMGRILRSMGWETAEAEDGTQALNVLRSDEVFKERNDAIGSPGQVDEHE